MIRCSCCERLVGHSIDPCKCAANYCPKRLLCDALCDCTAEALQALYLAAKRRAFIRERMRMLEVIWAALGPSGD